MTTKEKMRQTLDDYYHEIKKHTLSLKPDWNGYGGIPFTRDFWNHVMAFLTDFFTIAQNKHLYISLPEIHPVGNGSLDLSWSNTPPPLSPP